MCNFLNRNTDSHRDGDNSCTVIAESSCSNRMPYQTYLSIGSKLTKSLTSGNRTIYYTSLKREVPAAAAAAMTCVTMRMLNSEFSLNSVFRAMPFVRCWICFGFRHVSVYHRFFSFDTAWHIAWRNSKTWCAAAVTGDIRYLHVTTFGHWYWSPAVFYSTFPVLDQTTKRKLRKSGLTSKNGIF